MLVKNPKYRKALNSNQIRLLKIAYKFRFVSVPLLSEYLEKDKSTVYEQLLVLLSQEYITKDYDSSYRLPPRPATYSLANKGIKFLRDTTDLSRTTLRNMYKNKTASEPLIERSLSTMEVVLKLRKQYPDKFDIFTKSEMSQYEAFIRPLPDLYLRRRRKQTSKQHAYLLELLEPSVASWILRKRIQAYQDHFDESEIDNYPCVLFVATNDSTEQRIRRMLEDSYLDFELYTTTTN